MSVVDAAACSLVATIPMVFGTDLIDELAIGIRNERLYVASYGSAVAVFDISDLPKAPRHLSTMTLPGAVMGLFPSLESRTKVGELTTGRR